MLLSRYSFPAADPDLLGTFYPELIGCMLDMQDVDDDYIDGANFPVYFCCCSSHPIVTTEHLLVLNTPLRTAMVRCLQMHYLEY